MAQVVTWAWTSILAVQLASPSASYSSAAVGPSHPCPLRLIPLQRFPIRRRSDRRSRLTESWEKLRRTRGYSNLFALCIFFFCSFGSFLLVLVRRRVWVAGYLLPEGEGGGLACAECFQASPDRRGVQHLRRWPKTSPCYRILQVAICETLFIR